MNLISLYQGPLTSNNTQVYVETSFKDSPSSNSFKQHDVSTCPRSPTLTELFGSSVLTCENVSPSDQTEKTGKKLPVPVSNRLKWKQKKHIQAQRAYQQSKKQSGWSFFVRASPLCGSDGSSPCEGDKSDSFKKHKMTSDSSSDQSLLTRLTNGLWNLFSPKPKVTYSKEVQLTLGLVNSQFNIEGARRLLSEQSEKVEYVNGCPIPEGAWRDFCFDTNIQRLGDSCQLTADCSPIRKVDPKVEQKASEESDTKVKKEQEELEKQKSENVKDIQPKPSSIRVYHSGNTTTPFNSFQEVVLVGLLNPQSTDSFDGFNDSAGKAQLGELLGLATKMGGSMVISTGEKELITALKDLVDNEIQEAKKENQSLDLIFMIDTTWSMIEEIQTVKKHTLEVSQKLKQSNVDVRCGLVQVKDDDTDSPFITEFTIPLNSDFEKVQEGIEALSVRGGGNLEEAGLDALDRVVKEADFRKDARHTVIYIGDNGIHPKTKEGLSMDEVIAKCKQKEMQVYFNALVTLFDPRRRVVFQNAM